MGLRRVLKRFPNFVEAVRRGDWARAADELRYKDGLTRMERSDYWRAVGDRCERVARMLETGVYE